MAVVVSFNGGQKTVKTINALIRQVGHVHVVDNASNHESAFILKKYSIHSNVSITWLSENKGIGYALNIGIRIARERGYRWLLTMDQDSTADTAMVQSFSNVVNENPSFVCLTPKISEYEMESVEKFLQVDYAITSGNLVGMDVYDKIGLYNEELFIDCVDFDFSLRVRKAGMKIYLVSTAIMQHELGDKVCTFPVIGRFHTYHSPMRRYYIYRNYLYLVNRYAADFPGFVLKFTISKMVYIVTTLLFGDQRLKSIFYIFHGILDFLRDRKGPCSVGESSTNNRDS